MFRKTQPPVPPPFDREELMRLVEMLMRIDANVERIMAYLEDEDA